MLFNHPPLDKMARFPDDFRGTSPGGRHIGNTVPLKELGNYCCHVLTQNYLEHLSFKDCQKWLFNIHLMPSKTSEF